VILALNTLDDYDHLSVQIRGQQNMELILREYDSVDVDRPAQFCRFCTSTVLAHDSQGSPEVL
jgi:hypothetical protein